ncbi:MAG: FtsX-like permease family protein [Cyclobacteriaceae bacterium]
MLNKDLGFSTDSVVYISTPWQEKVEKRRALKNELKQIPEIEILSVHGSPPLSGGWSSTVMDFDNGKEIVNHNVYLKDGDTTYIRLYNIQLLAGRNVLPVDTISEYLINEKYMRLLGFEEPHDVLGKIVHKKFTIVGVVKDFHTQSLHSEITPTVIKYRSEGSGFGMKIFTPANKIADMNPAIQKIEAAWKKIYPDDKFELVFMDDSLIRFYEAEQRTGKLTRVATCIAILISCLGLFGLSSFTVIQRTKEIGIRKVMGATVNNIMFLLSKDFLKLVLMGFILSAPIAYYLMDKWLEKFAYRMDLAAWIFVVSGVVSLVIAFITISFRTVNAAKSDPVKSLRYE